MAQFLYASKDDIDMLTREVDTLKTSYRSIDAIAKRFNDLWHEQVCQGEQMGRMEDDIRGIKHRLDGVEQRLDKVEQRLDKVEQRLDKIEQRLDQIEQKLAEMMHMLSKLSTHLKLPL